MPKKKIPCVGEVFEDKELKGTYILGVMERGDGSCGGTVVLNVRKKTKQETIDLALDAIIKHGPHKAFTKLLDKHTKVC